jgi:hypothetical protein
MLESRLAHGILEKRGREKGTRGTAAGAARLESGARGIVTAIENLSCSGAAGGTMTCDTAGRKMTLQYDFRAKP